MAVAYVNSNLVDMWAEPSFDSERVNQVLFGEVVQISGNSEDGLVLIRQDDGYTGWMDERRLQESKEDSAINYNKEANWVVSESVAALEDLTSPHFLYYGTRLKVASIEKEIANAVLSDGRTFRLHTKQLRNVESRKDEAQKATVIDECRRFLGVPYLWGGISPAGFDCSGYVRAVFGQFGIALPRDTKDQINCGRKVERKRIELGDLLFFDRHVAIALGEGKIIHSSRYEGGVRISSLKTDDAGYRPDLDEKFACARRLL